MESSQTVRIFISSPSDVVEERDRARRVIEGLQRQYANVILQPVLWEELALPATASFQETIDFLLERQRIDVAVFIVWSRLGTPLGPAVARPDGTPYRSGTERELDVLLTAFELSGKKRPVILAYARDDDSGFRQLLTESPSSELEELIAQRKLADAFIREQFYDAKGYNVRAVHTYCEPIGFAQRLRVHLRQALDDLLGADITPRWLEEPYRGLEMFDVCHATIFFGRDEESCDLLQRLRDQDRAGCAFVVIVGASGSGKSSLARAGVAASLLQQAGEDGTKQWRAAFFVPSLEERDLCTGLAKSLAEAVPELRGSATAIEDIARGLEQDAPLTMRLSIVPAFTQATERTRGTVRVLLLLDQMEELWTDRRIAPEDRDRFLAAIESLSRSGHVATLATLRSDFYPQAQLLPTFVRLKGKNGHYDLLPPNAAALQRLITEPARLAELRFEREEQTGRTLDAVVLQDAARDPAALPLLQYALAELYRQRDDGRRLLNFSAYQAIGGVEGALGKRVEEVFLSLPEDAQMALSDILPLLVTVDVTGEQTAVRRRALVSDLVSTPGRRTLTEMMVAARFLTTDREGDVSVASLAHEALLRRWERIAAWVAENRDYLRMRARVEQNQQRWEQQNRDDTLLLPVGLALEEGRQLLSKSASLLNRNTAKYIQASIACREHQVVRRRRIRSAVGTAMSLLAIVALIGGFSALAKWRDAETQLKRSEWLRYGNQIASAQREWEFGNLTRAWYHLDSTRSDFRGWEYAYLHTLFDKNQVTLRGHTDTVTSVAVSPDGKRIATASEDRTVRVWDAIQGRELLTPKSHECGVRCVMFSPDGERIVSTDGVEVTAWNVTADTERRVTLFSIHPFRLTAAAISPDASLIVGGGSDHLISQEKLQIWDATSGTTIPSISDLRVGEIACLAFHPDGKHFVIGYRGGEVAVRGQSSLIPDISFPRHMGAVVSVAVNPDGTRIASGGEDHKTKVWDTTGGQNVLTIGHDDVVTSVAFSPDGKSIASGKADGMLVVSDAISGEPILRLKGHTGRVASVVFSPDGTRIVSGSSDHTVKLWNTGARQGPLILTQWVDAYTDTIEPVSSVAFSPDGKRIISGSEPGTLVVWDAISGQEMLTLAGHAGRLRRVTSSRGGTEIHFEYPDESNGHELWGLHQVNDVAFSPDGSRVIGACGSVTGVGMVKVWDVTDNREIVTLKVDADVATSFAFSPDGKRVVGGSMDGTLKLWNTNSGQELFTIQAHAAAVSSVAFSPDGTRIVSGGLDCTVKLWNTITGDEALTLKNQTDSVASVAFSPDGKQIVSGSADGTLKVWNANRGQEMFTIQAHAAAVCSVAFSPDDSRIVSGSADRTVKLWNTITGHETLTLKEHTDSVTSVAFSLNGTRIVSGSADGTLRVWDANWTDPRF